MVANTVNTLGVREYWPNMMNDLTKRSNESKLYVANIIEEGKTGGPQNRIIQVAKFIERHVETVVIMPQENSNEFQQRCQSFGVPFRAIPLSRITKEIIPALKYFFFTPWEIIQLIRFFRQEKFDLIHVSGGIWQFKGAIAGKLAGRKVLWHLNDTFKPFFFRALFSLLSPLADGYIYASERTKHYYRPCVRMGRPGFTIHPPVDTERFDPRINYPGDEELIQKLEGKNIIGTVANINPAKGLETLIYSAKSLNEQFPDIAFVVMGTVFKSQKRYFEKLQQLCEEYQLYNFQFIGGRSDVRPLLKRFDIFICSSISESGPMTLWEAMSMAKPIVSTDVGDVSHYVHDEENGFVVPIGDVDQLTNRILQILNDEIMCKRFGNNSRKIAQKYLDISFCGERHLNAYQQIYPVSRN